MKTDQNIIVLLSTLEWVTGGRGGTEYEARTVKGSGYGQTKAAALKDLLIVLGLSIIKSP